MGTWFSDTVSIGNRDTLIIREDGMYKQIIHLEYAEFPPFDYESEWLPWRLEYGENGIPYLHMEGLRVCAQAPLIDCDVIGGGEGVYWYDSCQNNWVEMPGEGILTVRGISKKYNQPPRGISLYLFQKSEFPRGYRLYETAVPTMPVTSQP